jgi:plastocyanin
LLVGAGYAAATFVAAPGQAAGPVLNATVGPGFTISLTQNGAPVTTLAPGSYTVNVSDNATIHNFHLQGPGGVDLATGVEATGSTSWDVTFSPGTYNFFCDPHQYEMHGTFTVSSTSTTSTATTTAATSTSTTISTTTTPSTVTTTTTTTTAPAPPAVTSAAVVQSVRVTATGRRRSRAVLVRIDLSKPAAVRVRLRRAGRTVASVRRTLGVRPRLLRLPVPAAAPGGRYALEIVATRSRASQRILRFVTIRP